MKIKFEASNGNTIMADVDYAASTPMAQVVPQFLQTVVSLARTVHAAVPLATVFFKVQDGSTTIYDYKLVAVDGRTWEQTIDFDVPTDPKQTFQVNPGWRKSEFVPARPLRDELERLVSTYSAKLVKLTEFGQ